MVWLSSGILAAASVAMEPKNSSLDVHIIAQALFFRFALLRRGKHAFGIMQFHSCATFYSSWSWFWLYQHCYGPGKEESRKLDCAAQGLRDR